MKTTDEIVKWLDDRIADCNRAVDQIERSGFEDHIEAVAKKPAADQAKAFSELREWIVTPDSQRSDCDSASSRRTP